MNLDEEVRLYTTNAERERTENLATLYSIIVSLEYLERAYVRDSVTGKEWVHFDRVRWWIVGGGGGGYERFCAGDWECDEGGQQDYKRGGNEETFESVDEERMVIDKLEVQLKRKTVLELGGLPVAAHADPTRRYAPACIKLLAQYKSLMKLVGDEIGGVEAFMKRFKVGANVDEGCILPSP
jgi:ESCRT-I complex subunit VPS28